MVTDDGEKRYPVTIWMVVVGPWVVQVEVRVAVFVDDGLGLGGADGAGFGVEEAACVAAGGAVLGFGRRLAGKAADVDGEPVGAVVAEADEVTSAGDWEPCTRTRPDPLLHAVTASARQSPAATVPGVRISA